MVTPEHPGTIRQSDIHPQMNNFMERYVSPFSSIQLRTILNAAANITEAQLPTLPKYIANRKNGLCYAYILGKCQGKMCGKALHGHTTKGDVTDAFAWELCYVLVVGVEKHLAMEPPTAQYQFLGGYSSKRFKGTA